LASARVKEGKTCEVVSKRGGVIKEKKKKKKKKKQPGVDRHFLKGKERKGGNEEVIRRCGLIQELTPWSTTR